MSWLDETSRPPLAPLYTAAPSSIKAFVVLSILWTISEPPTPRVEDLLPKNEKKLPAKLKTVGGSKSL